MEKESSCYSKSIDGIMISIPVLDCTVAAHHHSLLDCIVLTVIELEHTGKSVVAVRCLVSVVVSPYLVKSCYHHRTP